MRRCEISQCHYSETTAAPRTVAPDTGDHSHILLYVGMMGMAAAGSGWLLVRRKKDEIED